MENPVLNRMGLQVARTVAARLCYSVRPFQAVSEVSALAAELLRKGFVVIPNFLSPDDLAAVSEVSQEVLADPATPRRRFEHGANLLDVVNVAEVDQEPALVLNRFFGNPTLLRLAEAAERRPLTVEDGVCTVQYLDQRDGGADNQADVHSDTFFYTHKAWLYLTDVTEDDGPLVYYPGSQRLALAALRGIYDESCGPNEGSRRITEAELRRRRIEPKTFTVPKNTFVFANTFGYHARRLGRPGGRRLVLHAEYRANPFRAVRAGD